MSQHLEVKSESLQSGWELWRQDDNGVQVLIARYEDRQDALARMAELESSGHKQTYWITPVPRPAGFR